MKKERMFFSKNYPRINIKFAVIVIGALNALIWISWSFALLLALGTDGPKGDFGHHWIDWVLAHPIIAAIWTALGIYSLVKFIIFIVSEEKKMKNEKSEKVG